MQRHRTGIAIICGGLLAIPLAHAAPPPIVVTPDPPDRVGRLSHLSGAVSFHTAQQENWAAAVSNFPVTTGDGIWTEPRARAGLDLPGIHAVLDGGTELDVTMLDDHTLSLREGQGALYLHIVAQPDGDSTTVQFARGPATLTVTLAAGRYLVTAGDASTPATVTVVDGAAQIGGPGIALSVAANQTVTLDGAGTDADPVRVVTGPAQAIPFLTEMLAPPATPRLTGVAPAYVAPALVAPAFVAPAFVAPASVALMTGGEELSSYGTWQPDGDRGAVWYPQVDPGWVPYREGRWSNVAPWGWTWIDAAPWGFAPFHYGRWFQDDGRWGWSPGFGIGVAVGIGIGIGLRPVYAPALVSFFGYGVGQPVGWVPLGINEPYYPPYRAGLGYIRNINVNTVRNVTSVVNDNSVHINNYRNVSINRFVNRGGFTAVPAAVMQRSAPVAAAIQPAPPGVARVSFRPSVAPIAGTLGAPGRAAAGLPVAPGPIIRRADDRRGPLAGPRPVEPAPARGPGPISPPRGSPEPISPPSISPPRGSREPVSPNLVSPKPVGPDQAAATRGKPTGAPNVTAPQIRPQPPVRVRSSTQAAPPRVTPPQPRPSEPRPSGPRPPELRPSQPRPSQPRPSQARPSQPRPSEPRPTQPRQPESLRPESRPQPRPQPQFQPQPAPRPQPQFRPQPAPRPQPQSRPQPPPQMRPPPQPRPQPSRPAPPPRQR